MGFKELIIREQIMEACGKKVLPLPDSLLIGQIGLTPIKVSQVLLNSTRALHQEPVVNPITAHPKTVGDIVFCFYSAAERYKYFERIVLDALHAGGDFLKKSIHPAEELKNTILRDKTETQNVFDKIQCVTGRDYLPAYTTALKKGKMKTAQDLMTLLSDTQNGLLKISTGNGFWHKMQARFGRAVQTREG